MTIEELIKELKKYPQLSVIAIRDADTGWILNIEDVDSFKFKDDLTVVILNGSYGNEI